MRIAWISPEPTSAGQGGAGVYNRGILRILAAIPDVSEVVEIPLRPRPSPLPHIARQILSLVRSIFSHYPAKIMFHMPPRARAKLSAGLARARPDLVVISSADMLFCRPMIGDLPYLVVAHNVEQELYREQVERALKRVPLARGFLVRDLEKVRRVETGGLRHAALVIAISGEDVRFFEGLGIATPFFVMPPTFPGPLPAHARPDPARPLRLAFVAKLSWWPNRRGCEWLIREVMAKLPPGVAELHIYGVGSEAFSDPSAQAFGHGFVDDLNQVWRDNHIALCPIELGSGMNVKLVESLVNGMPTLTTPFGVRGMPAADSDPAIAVRDGAPAWIEFLRSSEAETFATLCPRSATREPFLDETHVGRLGDAITRVTGDPR